MSFPLSSHLNLFFNCSVILSLTSSKKAHSIALGLKTQAKRYRREQEKRGGPSHSNIQICPLTNSYQSQSIVRLVSSIKHYFLSIPLPLSNDHVPRKTIKIQFVKNKVTESYVNVALTSVQVEPCELEGPSLRMSILCVDCRCDYECYYH